MGLKLRALEFDFGFSPEPNRGKGCVVLTKGVQLFTGYFFFMTQKITNATDSETSH